MGYKHLTREQRYTIEALLQTPMSLREIGEVIGVSTGTVSREIRKNCDMRGYHRYDKPCILTGRPTEKPKDTSVKINHPNAESALKAAKAACRKRPGRRYGSNVEDGGVVSFLVYEGGTVVEKHGLSGKG